jgi:hypothetical protein
MPVVVVPAAYQGPTAGLAEIQVEAATVVECLREVERKHPGFLELILDRDGGVHRFVKLFVNEQPLSGKSLDRTLAPKDRLEILAAIAGG